MVNQTLDFTGLKQNWEVVPWMKPLMVHHLHKGPLVRWFKGKDLGASWAVGPCPVVLSRTSTLRPFWRSLQELSKLCWWMKSCTILSRREKSQLALYAFQPSNVFLLLAKSLDQWMNVFLNIWACLKIGAPKIFQVAPKYPNYLSKTTTYLI